MNYNASMKKKQFIRGILNEGERLRGMAFNKLVAWERYSKGEGIRRDLMRRKVLGMVVDRKFRALAEGFRTMRLFREWKDGSSQHLVSHLRGVCKRILNKNVRLVGQGYNKLEENWRLRKDYLRGKLEFMIKNVRDGKTRSLLMAYNGMKERKNLLAGIGVGQDRSKKTQLIKRLIMDKFGLKKKLAFNKFREFLSSMHAQDRTDRNSELTNQQIKKNLCRRIMNKA